MEIKVLHDAASKAVGWSLVAVKHPKHKSVHFLKAVKDDKSVNTSRMQNRRQTTVITTYILPFAGVFDCESAALQSLEVTLLKRRGGDT